MLGTNVSIFFNQTVRSSIDCDVLDDDDDDDAYPGSFAVKGPSTVTEDDDLSCGSSGSHSADLGSGLDSDMKEVDSWVEACLGSWDSVRPMAAVVDVYSCGLLQESPFCDQFNLPL